MIRTKLKTVMGLFLGFATAGFARHAQAESVRVVGADGAKPEQSVEIESSNLADLERSGAVVRNPETDKPEIDPSLLERLEKTGILKRSTASGTVDCET